MTTEATQTTDTKEFFESPTAAPKPQFSKEHIEEAAKFGIQPELYQPPPPPEKVRESLPVKFSNLFRGKKNDAIEKLRQVEAENEKDRQWIAGLRSKGQLLQKESEEALAELSRNPCDTTVEKAEAAMQSAKRVEVWDKILEAIFRGGMLAQRKIERTDPACRDALGTIIERLQREKDAIIADDEARAARYGIQPDHANNTILRDLDDAIAAARSFLQQLPFTRNPDQYVQVIRFCLDYGK